MTGLQQAFVDNYCSNGFNGVQAAKSAGYSGSDNVLAQRAFELVRNSKVMAAIDAYTKKRQKKCEFDREQSERELIQAQLRAIAKGDVGAEIAAIREKNTIFALRIENIHTTTEEQRELSEREIEEAKEIANYRNKKELNIISFQKPKEA